LILENKQVRRSFGFGSVNFSKQKKQWIALHLLTKLQKPSRSNYRHQISKNMMKFRFSARRTKKILSIPSDAASSISSTCNTSGSSELKTTKYEYGDTRRTEHTIAPSEVDASEYGYEDCSPSQEIAAKYDYGDTSPAGSRRSATPRRSSMKHGEDNNRRRPRRASIGYTGEIEVNLPGKREPVRRRTSISFCEEDQINEVVPVKSLTDKPEALWFQDEEYSVMKKKMCSLIHAVERGEASTKQYCVRGLEGHFGEGAQSKGVSRETAWDAVLREQHMQQNEGSFDDEGISMLYRLSSIESKIKAAQRATQDESEVEHYQKETRRRMRRMSM
jgi:hypothetical protein